MTELAGVNADRVSAFSWMLSSLFAGLAGVLLAPLYASLAPQNFTTLLVAAIAAAAFARLTSIPLALLGGILLGVAQAAARGLPPTRERARAEPPAVAAVRRVVPPAAVLARTAHRDREQGPAQWRRPATDGAGRGHPQPGPHASATRIFGVVVGGVVLLLAMTTFNEKWVSDLHDRGDLLGHLPVDHRHHRDGGRDLALSGDVRGQSARSPPRSSCSVFGLAVLPTMFIGALVAALVGRADRDPAAAPRWHLPVARDAWRSRWCSRR